MRAFIFTGVLCTVTFCLPGQSTQSTEQSLDLSSEVNNITVTPADSIIVNTFLHLNKGREMVATWSEAASMQSRRVDLHYSGKIMQVHILIQNGKTAEAMAALENLRAQTRKCALTPVEKFDINYLTGQLYLRNHKPTPALHFFNEARRTLKSCNPELQARMNLYHDIIESYLEKNTTRKGIRACEKFLEEIRRNGNDNSLFEISMQLQKARLYQKADKHEKAIAGFEYLVDVYPKFVPESDPAFIALLSSLAKSYRANSDHHHAYVYLRWAYEKMHEQSVRDPEQVLDVITNLAEVYTVKGDDDSARQYFDEARLLATAGKYR